MIYRFGEFRLDAAREILSDAGGPVALRDHALRVLKLLIERAPEVVSKDEILTQVWGHDALSESSVPQVIKDIRQVLRDSAKSPELIVTRYGRGYQFIGYVDVEAPGDVAAPPPSTSVGTRSRWLLSVGAGVSLLLATIWLWRQPVVAPTPADPEPIWVMPIETDDPAAVSNAFAEYLRFVADGVGAGRPIELTRTSRQGQIDLDLRLDQDPQQRYQLQMADHASASGHSESSYASSADLVRSSLERIYDDLDPQQTAPAELGLISDDAFATELLLRGLSAQLAGENQRAITLLEACLAEDSDFDYARYVLALALRRNGDYQRTLAELSVLQSRHQSAFWLNRIHNARGVALWRLGRYGEAEAALKLAYGNAHSGRNRATAGTNLALLARDQGDLALAETRINEAIAEVDAQRYPAVAASAQNTLASILLRRGRLEQAIAPLQQAQELFYASGDQNAYASVLSRHADVLARLGQYDQAEQQLRQVLAIRQQIQDQMGTAASLIDLAELVLLRGDFGQARELALNGLQIAADKAESHQLGRAQRVLAEIAMADQRYAEALAHAGEAIRLARSRDEPAQQRAAALLALEIRIADPQAAADAAQIDAQLEALLSAAQSEGDEPRVISALLLRGRWLLQQGDTTAARLSYQLAREQAQQLTHETLRWRSLLALAALEISADPAAATAL
ncbi:MAG: tetratricopeptide repeat protein, partial [Xanthomonadales bacterium]|nr:tetratricopeptide repeat protein [Xanthomonadales bacterium]